MKIEEVAKLDQSANDVLPTLRHFLDVEKRSDSSTLIDGDDVSRIKEGFAEINLARYLSMDIRSRSTELESGIELKQGFKYQSSKKESELREFPRLQKSQSLKGEMLHQLFSPRNDHSTRSSSRSRFRKMLKPFMNSKPPRAPSGYGSELGDPKLSGREDIPKEKMFHRSMLNYFTRTRENQELVKKAHHGAAVMVSSPVHLHGRLKLSNRHGMPVFKFMLECRVYVAVVQRSDDDHHWVYTFHSIDCRKNDPTTESSMVGQMKVLYSKVSAETEFVMYNAAHAHQSSSARENSTKVTDANESSGVSKLSSVRRNHKLDNDLDLHPGHEIAAIIIKDPSLQKESTGCNVVNRMTERKKAFHHYSAEKGKKDLTGGGSPGKLTVLIPAGNHGLPSMENSCPSPLLQRWRSGGGCDCGGWDMGCQLLVLSNPSIQLAEDQPLADDQHVLELFSQGGKESTPALSMTLGEEGNYRVHFHAQLSALQAFSTCVAILHGTIASTASRKEKSVPFSQCNSLKELIDEEAKSSYQLITEERDKEKEGEDRIVKGIPPSFMPNVSFSPISRV